MDKEMEGKKYESPAVSRRQVILEQVIAGSRNVSINGDDDGGSINEEWKSGGDIKGGDIVFP